MVKKGGANQCIYKGQDHSMVSEIHLSLLAKSSQILGGWYVNWQVDWPPTWSHDTDPHAMLPTKPQLVKKQVSNAGSFFICENMYVSYLWPEQRLFFPYIRGWLKIWVCRWDTLAVLTDCHLVIHIQNGTISKHGSSGARCIPGYYIHIKNNIMIGFFCSQWSLWQDWLFEIQLVPAGAFLRMAFLVAFFARGASR